MRTAKTPSEASPPQPQQLFPGGALPAPETTRRRRSIQTMALVALAISAAYLTWRATSTLGADLWISLPLWLLELHAAAGLGLYAFSLWNVDAEVVAPPAGHSDLRVALLIPTYNEPAEVLLPTVAAAVALEPAHETVVLDDGQRVWVRAMAASLGARYMTRTERDHAKAGNLNHALSQLEDFDVVGVLDADHVATEDFLAKTLGYFEDPRVAVVQTPQDFYNLDSFEHDRNRSWFWRARRSVSFGEQQLFYRALQPGKNRWQAAFWCGTNALVRVSALMQVGGIACETVTEDMHTTIRLHRKGWRTVYHNEVLAHGLAARNAAEYQTQRIRWGTGAMQIMRLERPLTGKGLSVGQRVAYAATLLGWFDAWRTLGYAVLPAAVLFSGAAPVHASLGAFAIAFGTTFGVQRLAMALLSRGYAPQGMATLFEFVRMQSNLRATLTYLNPVERPFRVTSKQGSEERRRTPAPWLLWALLGLTVAAFAWFACTLVGVTPIDYSVPWTAYGALFWGLVNAGFLAWALSRIRSDRFASERRTAARMRVTGPVTLDGREAHLIDISMGGALLRCEQPPEPAQWPRTVELRRGGQDIALLVEERGSQRLADGSLLLRLQFAGHQTPQLAQLARALFGGAEGQETEAPAETPLVAADSAAGGHSLARGA